MAEGRKLLKLTIAGGVVIHLLPSVFRLMKAGNPNAVRFWEAFHKNFKPRSEFDTTWDDFFQILFS